jgi:hypothetical protein
VTVDLGRRPTKILTTEGAPDLRTSYPPSSNIVLPNAIVLIHVYARDRACYFHRSSFAALVLRFTLLSGNATKTGCSVNNVFDTKESLVPVPGTRYPVLLLAAACCCAASVRALPRYRQIGRDLHSLEYGTVSYQL